MMGEEVTTPRVRIHFEMTAKGLVPLDVTGEASTVPEAAQLVHDGLIALEKEVSARGLKTTASAVSA